MDMGLGQIQTFCFTVAFGEQACGVHHYARRLGHELVTRRDLLLDESDHLRTEERYHKLPLDPFQKRKPVMAT